MSEAQPGPRHENSAAQAGRPIIVDVFAQQGAGGSVSCRHEWRFEDGSSQGSGTIEVPARKHSDPGTPIHFHLHDSTGRDLRFDSDDPIWVSRDTCPNQSCEDSEMPRKDHQASPRLLKVHNRNSEECELHYNLRFKDRSGESAEYDPAIKNGGTST